MMLIPMEAYQFSAATTPVHAVALCNLTFINNCFWNSQKQKHLAIITTGQDFTNCYLIHVSNHPVLDHLFHVWNVGIQKCILLLLQHCLFITCRFPYTCSNAFLLFSQINNKSTDCSQHKNLQSVLPHKTRAITSPSPQTHIQNPQEPGL